MALNNLLPGFHDEVVSMGGIDLDLGQHVYYFDHHDIYPRFVSNLRGLGVSRPFLEQCLRDRVFAEHKGKLVFIQDTMQDLIMDGHQVKGIVLRSGRNLKCEICIDASGRSSVLPMILRKKGLQEPAKVSVDARIKSASRLVRIPDNFKEVSQYFSFQVLFLNTHAYLCAGLEIIGDKKPP